MPKKLLHIINDLAIGGSEMMLCRLLSRMDRNAFEPVVLCLMDGGTLRGQVEAMDIQVVSPGMTAPLPSPASVRAFVSLVRQIEPDLIQGWMYQANLAATIARTFSKVPPQVLWGIRNSLWNRAEGKDKLLTAAAIRIGKTVSHLPDGIVYVSHANRAQHEAVGYANPNSWVVPNGFDASSFAPSARTRAQVRSELSVADGEFLIGVMQRFHPSKDYANCLRAASILTRHHPEVRFVLCGTGVNEGNSRLAQLANDLGVRDKLLLLGERQDVAQLMTALDALACSSRKEAFPNAVGEAMSAAVPVVATDVGDVRWLLGETGIVVPPANPEALASGLKSIIEMCRDERHRLGNAARQRIKDHFSLDSIAQQYEILYQTTIARSVKSR